MSIHRFFKATPSGEIGTRFQQGKLQLQIPKALKLLRFHHHVTQMTTHRDTSLAVVLKSTTDGADTGRLELIGRENLHRTPNRLINNTL